MSSPSARRRALRVWSPVALVGVLFSSGLVTPAAGAGASGVEWVVPVSGSVVSAFREPVSRYGAGHRGVDFAAATGTPVKAANDGQVAFAGTVAGGLHVVVGHAGGIRTSYSFLSSVAVTQGQRVRRGQVVGTAGGSGDGHSPGVLHFGVRIGERYVDPMLLFRPPDLTEMVRLVPVAERAASDVSRMTRAEAERRAREMLEDSFGHGLIDDAIDVVAEGLEWAGSSAQRYFDAGVEFATRIGGGIGDWIAARYDDISAAAEALAEGIVDVIEAVGQAIVDVAEALIELGERVYESLFSCPQPDSRSAADQPKSDHLAIAVGGRDSSRTRKPDGSITPSFDFRWRELGFERDHVAYFSYSNRGTYDASDTHGDLHREARDLGTQIRARAAAQPGRPVDLFGHSQGGVVIAIFLQEVYRGHEAEYPPIENVVTYASPLQGTPTANVGVSAERTAVPELIPGNLESFDLDSTALRQLCEGSPTIERLWREPPPKSVHWLSIAGMEDLVVPSPSTEVPGAATEIVVAVGDHGLDDHSGIVADDDAISATQTHLRGEAVGGCGVLAGSVGDLYANVVREVSVAASVLEVESEVEALRPRRRSVEPR
jgi:hypothetical protein